MTESDPQRERYENFVHAHAAELHRFAYRLTGRADVSQDLVQETFLEAWRSIAQLKSADKGRAWLFSILRHRWAHLRRDASRRIQTVPASETLHTHPSTAASSVDALAEEESLQTALDTLDPPFKETFLMVFMQGLTCKEAAGELGVPLGTILSRLNRAREALRITLSKTRHGYATPQQTEVRDA